MLALFAAAAPITSSSDHWFFKSYPEYLGANPSHIAFMMIPFFVTVVVVYHLAIKPLMHVLEEREHRTLGAREEAAELEGKFNERLKAWEARLAETRAKSAEERARIRKEAIAEEEKVLNAARNDAQTAVNEVRAQVETERVRVRADLRKQAEALAHELAEKALGREIAGGGTGASRQGARTGATS